MKNPEQFLIKSVPWMTYIIPYKGVRMKVIASIDQEEDGDPWEHVSVSLTNRCPTWDEMCHIKKIFWNEDEMCMQFHPVKSDYVNLHKFCLHLWKPPQKIYDLFYGML